MMMIEFMIIMMMHESTDEYDNEAKMGLSRCLPGDLDRIQRKWGRWHSKGQLLSQLDDLSPFHWDLCIEHLVGTGNPVQLAVDCL